MQAAETKAPEGKLAAVKALKSESNRKMVTYNHVPEGASLLQKLSRLFPNPPAVPKIQSRHAFISCDGNKLKIMRFSNAKDANFMRY